jgi:hypothetical protein
MMNKILIDGVTGAFIAGILLLIICWPFVVIWAANTLFMLNIQYTFLNWLAGLVLISTFGYKGYRQRKSD